VLPPHGADQFGGPAAKRLQRRLRGKPVVTAPLVGANTISQIDDAVASLGLELAADEVAALERPYTARFDWQGISGEAELQRIRDQIAGYANA
jgi:hypothetical protein